MGIGILSEKFRHGGKIPTVRIGKRREKILLWWEIPSVGEKSLPLHGSFSTAAPVLYAGNYLPLFSQCRIERKDLNFFHVVVVFTGLGQDLSHLALNSISPDL